MWITQLSMPWKKTCPLFRQASTLCFSFFAGGDQKPWNSNKTIRPSHGLGIYGLEIVKSIEASTQRKHKHTLSSEWITTAGTHVSNSRRRWTSSRRSGTWQWKYLDVPLEVRINGWDQWVITPRNIPFIGRWNSPLILTIDPNFQRDILVVAVAIHLVHLSKYVQRISFTGGPRVLGICQVAHARRTCNNLCSTSPWWQTFGRKTNKAMFMANLLIYNGHTCPITKKANITTT